MIPEVAARSFYRVRLGGRSSRSMNESDRHQRAGPQNKGRIFSLKPRFFRCAVPNPAPARRSPSQPHSRKSGERLFWWELGALAGYRETMLRARTSMAPRVAQQGNTPADCSKGRPYRAWFVGLIRFQPNKPKNGLLMLTNFFSALPRGKDIPQSNSHDRASGRGEVGIMPPGMVPSLTALNRCCKNYQIGLATGNPLLAHRCLRVRCGRFLSLDFRRSRP